MKENRQGFLSRRYHKISELVQQVLKFSSAWRESPQDFFAKLRNMLFSDLRTVLERLGFHCRIKGDHFIFTKDGVDEIINLQPIGNQAKPYQVKQGRTIILRYQLGGDIFEI